MKYEVEKVIKRDLLITVYYRIVHFSEMYKF